MILWITLKPMVHQLTVAEPHLCSNLDSIASNGVVHTKFLKTSSKLMIVWDASASI